MYELKSVIMDEIAVVRAVKRVSYLIIEKNHGCSNLCLIGICRRGVPLAERIQENIFNIEGDEVPLGKLDITLYRDDISMITPNPVLNGTDIKFDITGKDVVLVDDVLYTGRTARAAIDALVAIGRPSTVQLAVLIDRGHREFPIRADYVGKNIPTSRSEMIMVKMPPYDANVGVELYKLG